MTQLLGNVSLEKKAARQTRTGVGKSEINDGRPCKDQKSYFFVEIYCTTKLCKQIELWHSGKPWCGDGANVRLVLETRSVQTSYTLSEK